MKISVLGKDGDFLASPVVKTPVELGFSPWLSNWDPVCHMVQQRKLKLKNYHNLKIKKNARIHSRNKICFISFW